MVVRVRAGAKVACVGHHAQRRLNWRPERAAPSRQWRVEDLHVRQFLRMHVFRSTRLPSCVDGDDSDDEVVVVFGGLWHTGASYMCGPKAVPNCRITGVRKPSALTSCKPYTLLTCQPSTRNRALLVTQHHLHISLAVLCRTHLPHSFTPPAASLTAGQGATVHSSTGTLLCVADLLERPSLAAAWRWARSSSEQGGWRSGSN